MDANEKRHFKLFSGKKNSTYIEMFDAIDQQKIYDELSLKQRFGEKGFSVLKSYLSDRILDGLRSHYLKGNNRIKLRNQIDHIELLFRRGLYQQALRETYKGRKVAQKFDEFLLEIELMKWQSRILRIQLVQEYEGKNELAQIQDEMNQLLIVARQEHEIRAAYDSMLPLVLTGVNNRDPEILEHAQQIVDSPALAIPYENLPFSLKIIHLYVKIFYYQIHGEKKYGEIIALYKRMMGLWEVNPARLQDEEERYLNAFRGCMEYSILAATSVELEQAILKIKKIKFRTKNLQIEVQVIDYYLQLNQLIAQKRYVKAAELGMDIQQFLSRENNHIHPVYLFPLNYNLGLAYFYNQQFSAALKCIDKFVQENIVAKNQKEILNGSKMLYLMLQYELGNQDILLSFIKNFRTALKKNESLYEFEKEFLTFLKRFIKSTDPENRDTLLARYKNLLLEQEQNSSQSPTYYPEIKWWLSRRSSL